MVFASKMTKSFIIIIYSFERFSYQLMFFFLLEFEWQQASSSLQGFSKYDDQP